VSSALKTVALVGLMLSLAGTASATFSNEAGDTALCDVSADYSLGTENYLEAIRAHVDVLRRDPRNALAHYHLGFAYGITGQRDKEIQEYQRALALGLNLFDLFLNLGLARLERGDLVAATEAFQSACGLSGRPDAHFDLGLVYERRGMLGEAGSEFRQALAHAPNEPDHLNMLAIVAAEKGDLGQARQIWSAILSRNPDHSPAAANLRIW
jgi:tetratricopeptide (TPR) repeat protein